eukprot:SAG31_NODE_4185_length_3494_cov_1.707511_5_plen_79_part_00
MLLVQAYNVGTFHVHRDPNETPTKGVKGNKKRFAARFFESVAERVASVAAEMLKCPSAGKTFALLTKPLSAGGLGVIR